MFPAFALSHQWNFSGLAPMYPQETKHQLLDYILDQVYRDEAYRFSSCLQDLPNGCGAFQRDLIPGACHVKAIIWNWILHCLGIMRSCNQLRFHILLAIVTSCEPLGGSPSICGTDRDIRRNTSAGIKAPLHVKNNSIAASSTFARFASHH